MTTEPSLPYVSERDDLGWRNRIPRYTSNHEVPDPGCLEWWAMAPADSLKSGNKQSHAIL